MAWPLGRDHDYIQIGARHHPAEVNIEAVGEGQRRAFLQLRFDLLVNLALMLVGGQNHHHIGRRCRVLDRLDRQAGFLGFDRRRGIGAQADDDVDAGIAQIERVGVALRAVADNGDGFSFDQG
jgi:hypothetical protein